MKKISVLLVLAIFSFAGCVNQVKTPEQQAEEAKQRALKEKYKGFSLIVIDSCEYLIKVDKEGFGDCTTRYGLMSHKGNCKFCEERGKHLTIE